MKITSITIDTNSNYNRYKSIDKIEPGQYLQLEYVKKEQAEEFKKYLPLQYATTPTHPFLYLTPDEPWIRRYLQQPLKATPMSQTTLQCNVNKDILGKLRGWQKKILFDFFTTAAAKKPWKRGLIAGLGGGKTLIALLLCSLTNDSLYIAPTHLHTTIKDEAIKWGLKIPTKIITPESVKKVLHQEWDIVILDECLSCKNPAAARSRNVTQLIKTTDYALAMTGTPLSAKNALDVRWLRAVEPIVSGEEKNLKWLYGVNPHYTDIPGVDLGVNSKGEKIRVLAVDSYDVDKLTNDVHNILYTVDISDIMAEIPPMTKQRIYLPKPEFFTSIKKGLLTNKTTSKSLTQARTCTSGFVYADNNQPVWLPKQPKIAWLEKFIEDNPGEPIVVMSYWTAERNKLVEVLQKYSPATEDSPGRFTSGETNLLILSADAAEGLNLQRSRIQIFLSNSTKPVKRTQALGRLYRQGQKRGVICYDLVCKDTLDEIQIDLLEKHSEASEAFINSLLERELQSC